ncbi:sulfate transporter-like [Plakobranchus ocellatus]|uniref:Sulfate transporter-like n=1 Tax=Plakobranchus ocellatus TaxID=259542 RepID=A0AAV4AH67_9GAST|nr:sulfate transporter-like [Plakobranchus ocellatus]
MHASSIATLGDVSVENGTYDSSPHLRQAKTPNSLEQCPEEDTISLYPLNNFKMGFRFKPFKFVSHDLLYVHCNALVCRAEDDTRLYDRSCNNAKPNTAATGKKRKKRAIFDKFIRVVRSPMIILYDSDSSQQGIHHFTIER